MSKIVRVQNSDYKIIVGSDSAAGNIILDTNPTGLVGAQGTVTVTGDLTVLGNTTVIESETLTIKDNIIYINDGETGTGVSSLGSVAGIQIDRGQDIDVSILWDELLISRNPLTNLDLPGTFKFIDASSNLYPIATNSINTLGGNLALISSGTGVITVRGTTNYEERIFDYSKLGIELEIDEVSRSGNVATITVVGVHGLISGNRIDVRCATYPSFNGTFIPITVVDSNTFTYPNIGSNVILTTNVVGTVFPNPVIDDDNIPNIRAVVDYTTMAVANFIPNKIAENDTIVQVKDFDTSGVSEITITVDGMEKAKVNNLGLIVDNININNNNIINTGISDNILVDSKLSLAFKSSNPTATVGYVTIYSKSQPGTGGTGLYFVNPAQTDDELISKTKAILYSLIL